MSLTTPNDAYFKSRRALMVASGLLALAVFVGIEPAESNSSSTIFSLKLTSPDKIQVIFAVVLAYTIWQLWAAWLTQTPEVRAFPINKFDVRLSFTVALLSLVCFFWPTFSGWATFLVNRASAAASERSQEAISLLSAAISVLVALMALLRSNAAVSARIRVKRRLEDSVLEKLLVSGSWELVFNPTRKSGSKIISFLVDGRIGEGRNANEYGWRVRDGTLEILNEMGAVFSRFREVGGHLEHTNDEDTLSLRHQLIVPRRSSTE
ncbi:hypothetical protein LK996_07075 [Lysobacter sp. A6]|uniref:Uncharacterized protein n=1 Tax=Noviluteimonas lactosilytica TaxID=2888523 RepID=A0ABS8JGZ8_9GAMM|nr:hypothetical protein [Lysobacter lactosilyticus]MCC8362837.1 hypothetical protein [Lysobacter lactosilyticus]